MARLRDFGRTAQASGEPSFDSPVSDAPSALALHARLSAALRVAELSGIDSLARHYRDRLALEAEGAVASSRLLQILRYVELSQFYPTRALTLERARLQRSGMSAEEIAELSAVIEFVSFQARALVAFGCLEDAP